ncbi:MAG TPA: hypothetical protein VFI20_09140 [Terracidiphilus sp.]|nr:hypothetical protein [Terracidiphilus sp.]
MPAIILDLQHLHWAIVLATCIVLWLLASLTMSFVSGWHTLIDRFRKREEPASDTLDSGAFSHLITMSTLGFYPGLLRLSSAREALFISAALPCRFGHPPLRIPWSEVKLGERQTLLGWRMIITLGIEERVTMRITARVARQLGLI